MNKFFHSKYFYAGIAPLTIAGGALFLFWPILSGKVFFTGDFWGLYYYSYFSAMKFFVYGQKKGSQVFLGSIVFFFPLYYSPSSLPYSFNA